MDYRQRPLKDNGERATKEEDELLRVWIKEFLNTGDMSVVETYYLCYTMMANPHFRMDMLLNDLKTLSRHEFIVKWSNGLQICTIGWYVYDHENFEADFPDLYESLSPLIQ
jgi:hypothetical protein